jgi:hypothetical protein
MQTPSPRTVARIWRRALVTLVHERLERVSHALQPGDLLFELSTIRCSATRGCERDFGPEAQRN